MNESMGTNKLNWRILKTLSNVAFYVLVLAQVLEWYQWSQLDEAVITDPALRSIWLSREHLYHRVGLISLIVMAILRIAYWIIEYIHDRQFRTVKEGDRWQKDQITSL